jgi:hypothetical protein
MLGSSIGAEFSGFLMRGAESLQPFAPTKIIPRRMSRATFIAS